MGHRKHRHEHEGSSFKMFVVAIGWLAIVIVAAATFGVIVAKTFAAPNTPMLVETNGTKTVVYADAITTVYGDRYMVTVTDVHSVGKPAKRVADAYSLTGPYAEITGIGDLDNQPTWTTLYACSKEEVQAKAICQSASQTAEMWLNEMVRSVVAPENIIGNHEIYWAWEMERKKLLDQIR